MPIGIKNKKIKTELCYDQMLIKKTFEHIFKTEFILLFVILQEAIKTISSIFFFAESMEIVGIRFASLIFSIFLAYFVYKNSTIATAFFCIQLFIIGAIGISQNILYLQSINITAKIIFLALSIYYIVSSIVITRRSKIEIENEI